MKKKIIGGLLVMAVAAFNVNLNLVQESNMSPLALANVEALAQNEGTGGDFKYKIDKDPCTFTVTTEAQANFIIRVLG
jgi:hypothetical protein